MPHDYKPTCPLCLREDVPIVDATGIDGLNAEMGELAIGEHTLPLPVFAMGMQGPMYIARCPMSGARLELSPHSVPGIGS